MKNAAPSLRSGCPIATTLDLIGDKWSLVIVRDMLNGKKRYNQFLESPEGITTNILASRLKRLQQSGIVTQSAYQDNPTRFEYQLSERGEALHPVLIEICRWANKQYPETWVPPKSFFER